MTKPLPSRRDRRAAWRDYRIECRKLSGKYNHRVRTQMWRESWSAFTAEGFAERMREKMAEAMANGEAGWRNQ